MNFLLAYLVKPYWNLAFLCKHIFRKQECMCTLISIFRLLGTEGGYHRKPSGSCLPPATSTSSRSLLPLSNEAITPLQLFGNTSICRRTGMHRAHEGGSQLHHGKAVSAHCYGSGNVQEARVFCGILHWTSCIVWRDIGQALSYKVSFSGLRK